MPIVALVRAKAKKLMRDHPRELRGLILSLARQGQEQLAFEVARASKAAVLEMTPRDIESLLPILHDWCSTDSFASFISGVAWREGVLSDDHIVKWAASPNLWTRRASLVSTVPLNLAARGSTAPQGEPARTLAICDFLVHDREDMIVKAMSWALRELARKDPKAVRSYMTRHGDRLAARVRREVANKLSTGLKNPKRRFPSTSKGSST